MADAGQATLTIRNVNGQATHSANGIFEAGFIEIIGRDLNTVGLLYYTLESGDFAATKKWLSSNKKSSISFGDKKENFYPNQPNEMLIELADI